MADPKGPTYVAYAVRERDGSKDVWTRIGAVFKHDKSDGFTLLLDALPVGRKVVLMPPKPDDEKSS
jgi:hypothetical protein